MIEIELITWLYGQHIGLTTLFILASANSLSLLIYIFIFAILIQVILSWITPSDRYNPLNNLLYYMNEPLLRPVRRRLLTHLPPGLDLSPLIVIIGLQLADILVVGLLRQLAQ
jgi:YggT family protein